MLSRAMDLALSLVLSVVFLPLLIAIAILIRLDSRGPVLFIQDRLGLNGVLFRMYKFRTMQDKSEKTGTGLCSFENDPRVTRVGRFLRLLSLDELPQLGNVLRGEMSIVGPRPPVSYELGRYEDLSPKKRLRFRVKPGITGLAQVSGRNALDWESKIAIDNHYVVLRRRYGILLDIKILLQTIRVVFSANNVIEDDREHVTNTTHTI